MAKQVRVLYRKLRRPLEWLFIWLALLLIPPLSLANLRRLARLVADCAYAVDRRGRAISRANLNVMFGSRLTPLRERIIVRHSYRSMARVLINVFWMSRDTKVRMADQVAFAPETFKSIIDHVPAVLISAHIGNWEILSQACVANGIPVTSVAKEIGSPQMTARLTQVRSTIGQEIVSADGAIRPLLRALRGGRSIGLLVDQHTHLGEGGEWVNLFGLPAGISLAPVTLARKCHVPIVFAWSRPLKDGRYRIEPGEVFLPSPDIADSARLQQLANAFERVIRRHPSLWCLNYRRWRYVAPGDDPARYPFYARPARTGASDPSPAH